MSDTSVHTGSPSLFDIAMMRSAVAMARRGLGTTAPNPSVGAVVADPTTGVVIARGVTQPGGRPHAEPVALAVAGAAARGASIYVTLEPCSHTGRTPPCVDAILAAGIGRVVCGIEDPDPRVSGRGLARLRDAGVEVVRGVCREACFDVTRGHILRTCERRPFIILKMALGADGRIAVGRSGEPVWVTGSQARADGHVLRAEVDAILIGAGTLRADNPSLDCRVSGLEHRSPMPIVIAASALPPKDCRLLASRPAHQPAPIVMTTPALAASAGADGLRALGTDVRRVATLGGKPWPPAVAEALAECGVTRLLVEGGPTTWQAFATAGLCDEVVVYRARLSDGTAAAPDRVLADVQHYLPDVDLSFVESRRVGRDVQYRLRQVGQPVLKTSRGDI